MSSTKLKEDLSNCLINFDRRVLITQLLEDYRLSYDEVNNIVQDFLTEQEKKEQFKYEKRYLVHGLREDGNQNEIYHIVEEKKLAEWLEKLQNAESSLYSVEVAGGAKAAAAVFKPMRIEECVQSKSRQGTKTSNTNGEPEIPSVSVNKKETKEVQSVSKINKEAPKQPLAATPKKDSSVKKTPKKESPTEQKASAKKAAVKKGINNFFAPSAATTKKSDEKKPAGGVIKPPTPKKMVDFFKKQPEKSANIENVKKPALNTSIQLFDDKDEEEPEEEESSDEEEKLEALKRDIISSDVEMEEEEKPTSTTKRRRILDSEDEEDPPLKQEKLDVKEETKEEEAEAEEAVAETYLDEEGFVITKKPKQKATSIKRNVPPTKKTPPVTMKTSPKDTKKTSLSKDTKSATSTTSKTKQAGIMNFFSKK